MPGPLKSSILLTAVTVEHTEVIMEKMTGTREMDASAMVEYFAPLSEYLKEQNEGQTCGWD